MKSLAAAMKSITSARSDVEYCIDLRYLMLMRRHFIIR